MVTVKRGDWVKIPKRRLTVSTSFGLSQIGFEFVRGRCEMTDEDAKKLILLGNGKYLVEGRDGEVIPFEDLKRSIERHDAARAQVKQPDGRSTATGEVVTGAAPVGDPPKVDLPPVGANEPLVQGVSTAPSESQSSTVNSEGSQSDVAESTVNSQAEGANSQSAPKTDAKVSDSSEPRSRRSRASTAS